MLRFGYAILFVSLLVSIPAVFAQQDNIPIQYGETVSGVITEEIPCQHYRFDGQQGDLITLDMTRTSGSLDGVMSLYWQDDFTRDPIATNDDRPGGGLNPLIEHMLPETTWYTVVACRLQADQMRVTTGEYTLIVIGPGGDVPSSATQAAPDGSTSSGDAPLGGLSDSIFGSSDTATATATPMASLSGVLPGGAETLASGSVVEAELTADVGEVVYTLSVVAGDVVVIEWQRTSGDFAPLLRITESKGRVLALTATPDAVSALSLVLLAPADDTLTITVARHGSTIGDPVVDESAGAFTLAVDVLP